MRKGLVISLLLHLTIIALAVVGLPHFADDALMEEQPVVVDLVQLGERTAAPPPAPKPPKEEPPKPAPPKEEPPKPEPPKPDPPKPDPPKAEPPPPPPPPPPPKSEPEPAPPPPPKPEEKKAEPEPTPEPKPEVAKVAPPTKKPEPPKKAPEPKVAEKKPEPEPKKEPPKKQDDPFAALVKNVEKMRKQDSAAPASAAPSAAAAAPASGPQIRNAPFAAQATMTERDHIRAQIERHWLIDAGAQGLEDMAIVLNIRIDPAGNVVDARVGTESWGRYTTDPAFRAMTESALRAAKKASPLDYPRDKYEIFKDMQLVFRPTSRL